MTCCDLLKKKKIKNTDKFCLFVVGVYGMEIRFKIILTAYKLLKEVKLEMFG